jgi:hypothetical protein
MYCISSASERKHEIACTSWSSYLWKLCELVSNVEEQLCIVFMYTYFISRDSKMCTFEVLLFCVWCLDIDLGFCQVSLLNTFSMARLKTLQFHLTLTLLFTATHTLLFLSFTIFFTICDWGIWFIFVWPSIYGSYWFTVICEILKNGKY